MRFVDGRRVTSAAVLDVVRESLLEVNTEVCAAIGPDAVRLVGDEIGLRAEQDPKSVKDFHATILHALGLANDDLFFEHNGRPERLTGVAGTGKAIREVFA